MRVRSRIRVCSARTRNIYIGGHMRLPISLRGKKINIYIIYKYIIYKLNINQLMTKIKR